MNNVISRSLVFLSITEACVCLLQVQESETREVKDLSGMWRFRADTSDNRNKGFEEKWWEKSLSKSGSVIPMPVPSSYNDITTDSKLRDFIGWVWYETDFFVSRDWQTNKRVVLRFGSAHYNTIVWLNSVEVMRHSGGHLPFEAVVNKVLIKGQRNRLTVTVNNTLTPTTLPPGTITFKNDTNKYPRGYFTQDYSFDFFNYAGIHRPVFLYATSRNYIEDVTVKTLHNSSMALITYNATVSGATGFILVADILDADDNSITHWKVTQDR